MIIQNCDECHQPVHFAHGDPKSADFSPGDYFITAIQRLGGGYGKSYGWTCVYVHIGACGCVLAGATEGEAMKTDEQVLEEVNEADSIREQLITRWPTLSQKQADGIADYVSELMRVDLLAVAERAALMGFQEGLTRYSYWKDGKQYVGTAGWTLAQALHDAPNDPGLPAIARRAVEESRT